MKLFAVLIVSLFSVFSFAGVQGLVANKPIGQFSGVNCGAGINCSKLGNNLLMQSTGQSSAAVTAATAMVATSAACGTTFYNANAVQITLPLASSVIGCRITFVTLNASNFDVRANAADQILTVTSGVGRAARNAVVGSALELKAVSANKWAAVSIQGTYTDTP